MIKEQVNINISEELYDKVVLPHKKSKSFSKLVIALLEGFLRDDYISTYVEGAFSKLDEDQSNLFADTLADMRESMGAMGFFLDEVESGITKGVEVCDNAIEGRVSKVETKLLGIEELLRDIQKSTRARESGMVEVTRNKEEVFVPKKEDIQSIDDFVVTEEDPLFAPAFSSFPEAVVIEDSSSNEEIDSASFLDQLLNNQIMEG